MEYSYLIFRMKLFWEFHRKTLAGFENCCTFAYEETRQGFYILSQTHTHCPALWLT